MTPITALVLGLVLQLQPSFDLNIALLDHEDFAVREKARTFLTNENFYFDIKDRLNKPLPVQTKYTLTEIYSDVHALRRKTFDAAFTDFPMYDALFYNTRTYTYEHNSLFAQLTSHYFNTANDELGLPDPRMYKRYRMATRDMFLDAYDCGVPIFLLQLLSVEMYRVDRVFLVHQNRNLGVYDSWIPQWIPHTWTQPEWLPSPLQFENYDLEGLQFFLSQLQKYSE